MTLTTEREEFEKWAEQACGLPWGFLAKRRGKSGEYADQSYENMWGAWLASRELLANREAQPVAYTEQCEISNMQATGLYLRGFPDNSQGRNIPLYTAPPAPAVPMEMTKEDAIAFVRERPPFKGSVECVQATWNACRAAMLAKPVSSGYTLPDGWIACSERMPEVGEHDWRTALPVLVKCEIGVIPAYYGFTYHEGEQCFGFMESIKFGDATGSGPEQHENRLMVHVTHWMPLPAAPEGGMANLTARSKSNQLT